MPFSTESFHEFFKRGLDVKRGSLLLNTQAHDLSAVAQGRDPNQDGTRAARVAAHTVKIDLKHFKSWRIRYAYVCRSVQMRRLQGWRKTACMYICPNDLMILDPQEMKAYNQEPDACWECYSCVKICPQGAITARPYADFAPMGGTCIPMRSADSIMWTVKFRNGSVKRFKFPIRTTPEGSIKPFDGKPEGANLDDELLFTESSLAEPKEVLGKKFEVAEADKVFCSK